MTRWRDWPWTWKLAALIVAVSTVPIVVVTLFNESAARAGFIRESRRRNLQQAENTASLVTRYLREIVSTAEVLAQAPAAIEVLEAPRDTTAMRQLVTTLQSIQRAKGIDVLEVVDHGGTVVAATDGSRVGASRIAVPFFVSAMAGHTGVQDPRYTDDDHVVHVHVSVPLRDGRGRILGVAAGRVTLDEIDGLVNADTSYAGLGEFGMIWDEQGIVLSSPARPQRRFHPVAPLLPLVRDRLVAAARFGPGTAQLLDAPDRGGPLLEHSRHHLSDPSATPHVAASLAEGDVQVTSVPIAGTRWTYAIATPDAQVIAAARAESRRNLLLAFAMAAIAALLSIVTARRLARPLREVGDAARALAGGDMARRVRMARRDEIGELADTFDSMAEALANKDAELRRYAESLERRVDERTAELSGVLRAIPDLIYKVGAEGRIIEYVSAKDRGRGATPRPLIGRKLADLLPASIAARTVERIDAALAGKSVAPFEYRQVIGGSEQHFEARMSASGRDAVVILIRNITHRRRHEERARFLSRAASSLAGSLDYTSTVELLANLGVPFLGDICVVDLLEHGQLRLGSVTAVDPAHQTAIRASRSRSPIVLESNHPVARAVREGATLFRRWSAAAVNALAIPEEQSALIREIAPTSAMVLPLVARGQTLGAMTFASTVSARHYTDADLVLAGELADRAGIALDNARLYRELQESSRLKDEFLGTVSHELRTPLNAVLGWTQVLRRGMAGPDQTARALDAIERNALAQAQLVDDLLDTSRVVSGKLRIEFSGTDVADVIRSAIESFGPVARAKNVAVSVEAAPGLAPIQADPARLQQVIGNLLSNAFKFTPAGGRVVIAARHVGSAVEIQVSDSGAGIAPEFLPLVFDRFRQGDSTTTRAHGGLGLGLSIARHLVELHGGTIRAHSEGESCGSTFTVVMPVRASAATDAAARSEALDGAAAAIDRARILIVDDDDDARTLLKTMLTVAGARVDVAASAADARETVARRRPDVLISDIGMPREDGYELIRSIRREEEERQLSRLPAIAVTAYARDDDRTRAMGAGYDRHITKPVERDRLLQIVASLIGHGSSA